MRGVCVSVVRMVPPGMPQSCTGDEGDDRPYILCCLILCASAKRRGLHGEASMNERDTLGQKGQVIIPPCFSFCHAIATRHSARGGPESNYTQRHEGYIEESGKKQRI